MPTVINLPPITVPFDQHYDASLQMQMDGPTLDAILLNVDTGPLEITLPGIGPLQLAPNKREALRSLIASNPLSPFLNVRFVVDGNCDDFAAVTIESQRPYPSGTFGVNIAAFGMGIELELVPEITARSHRTEPCSGEEEGNRKVRTFFVEWYPKVTMTPGIVYAGNPVAEYAQLVRTPCCEDKGGW